MTATLAVLGGGNIGMAIARGLVAFGGRDPGSVWITRRRNEGLEDLREEGFQASTDNREAVRNSSLIFVCVGPEDVAAVVADVAPVLDADKHRIISVATGVASSLIQRAAGESVPVIRAMPNTAIAIGESMTCLARNDAAPEALAEVQKVFDELGSTLVIDEGQMIQATALCACGVAFFLRAIRAASQGGIEIGFHAEEALSMAAQTARGAASLLLERGRHPEREIDRVTTPMGCTIAGLNRMEHEGFSSALIRGIVTSAKKAGTLGQE